MKTELIAAVILCAAARLLNAEDPNPAQVHSRPAPPARPAAAPVAAAQARPHVSQPRVQGVAPHVAGTHGLGLGGGVYRSTPSYSARQFHPTADAREYHPDVNQRPNAVAGTVTPRVGNVPQQNGATNTT